jgi:hypothetical protein
MENTDQLTAERCEHLLKHAGDESAVTLARRITQKFELRPEQERKRISALRNAFAKRGKVGIEICLEVEEVRGLAHGIIYRSVEEKERAALGELERRFGPLPLSVDQQENGNGRNGEHQREFPCTLVDNLRLDFSNKLMGSVLQRAKTDINAHGIQAYQPAVSVKPKKTGKERTEEKKDAKTMTSKPLTDVLMNISNNHILPLLIPDESGCVAPSTDIHIPALARTVTIRFIDGALRCDDKDVAIERTHNSYAIRLIADPLAILSRLIPED